MRAQARGQRHDDNRKSNSGDDGEASSPDVLEELEEEECQTPSSFKQGRAGKYDNRRLSGDSWQRLKEGLSGRFTIESCSEIAPPQPKTYYAFQIIPHTSQPGASKVAEDSNVVIRIGAPDSQYRTPTCSCQDFEDRGTACKHVFWLLDQILDYSQADRIGETLPSGDDGCALRHSTPYDQIQKRTLASIAREHHAPFRRRSDTEASTPDDEFISRRKEQVRDILSTFHLKTLPEYSIVAQQEPLERSQSLQPFSDPRPLEGIIFSLAVCDESIFTALRRAVPPDYCASVFLDKTLAEALETLGRLDSYTANGSTQDSVACDVVWCANKLKELVNRIRHDLESRAPIGQAIKAKAFRLLVKMLEEVTNRNRDVYVNITWVREAPSDETAVDRNLYQRLIGNPVKASRTELQPQEKDKGNFVIDALRDLSDAGRDDSHRIQQILHTIEENGAPQNFIAELKRLKDQLPSKQVLSVGQSTGYKRIGFGEDRELQKRMK
ncbi:hypothetical protein GP486_000484 [Trichoglossum hirsutum]|uniref:SWIM-type domain-containing protein n=1 Tax=Trichoglossum hirsutum TaxID=265104 RepID=A0A9P8LIU9_9PEZI|nr:hypothetical protein GP486_000484 [Trichoglossum hirsutum]